MKLVGQLPPVDPMNLPGQADQSVESIFSCVCHLPLHYISRRANGAFFARLSGSSGDIRWFSWYTRGSFGTT